MSTQTRISHRILAVEDKENSNEMGEDQGMDRVGDLR